MVAGHSGKSAAVNRNMHKWCRTIWKHTEQFTHKYKQTGTHTYTYGRKHAHKHTHQYHALFFPEAL